MLLLVQPKVLLQFALFLTALVVCDASAAETPSAESPRADGFSVLSALGGTAALAVGLTLAGRLPSLFRRSRSGGPSASELAPSEEVRRQLFEQSADWVCLLGPDGRMRSINAEGRKRIEMPRLARLADVQWLELWKGDARAQAEQALAVVASGSAHRFRATTPTYSGALKSWDVRMSPLKGHDGDFEGTLIAAVDTTELLVSQERLSSLFAGTGEAQMIFDEHGMLDCNPSAVALLRHPDRASLCGKSMAKLSPPVQLDGSPSAELETEMARFARESGESHF